MSNTMSMSLLQGLKFVQMGLRNGNVEAAGKLLDDLIEQSEAHDARVAAAAAAAMPTCHPGYVDPAGS